MELNFDIEIEPYIIEIIDNIDYYNYIRQYEMTRRKQKKQLSLIVQSWIYHYTLSSNKNS